MRRCLNITKKAHDYLTAKDGRALRRRLIRYGRATLVASMEAAPLYGAPEHRELRFVMRGPSGTHSLLVAATNAARLAAHWKTFATCPANQERVA